ncbi:hypothetical protein K439DRAFT_1624439 [Ramaria rubella]|nr:hypothetical protein K439DRAFT_1624439 [Ramaria rubella]
MSSQKELAIQEQSDFVAYTYVIVAAVAYDTLLTFPSEVNFIWHKKFRLGTILHLLAHYPTLLQILLNVYLEFATFPSLQDLQFCVLFYKCFGFVASNWGASHNKLVFVMLALLGTISNVLFMISIPNNNCISSSNIFALCSTLFSKTEFMIHVSVETLNGVFTILFDTAVFVAILEILENTLGLLQLQSGIPGL